MSLNLEALETSFDLIAPRGEDLVDEYYVRFFAGAPETRHLFAADMKQQKVKVLATLVLLRKSLRNLDAVVPKLRALGAKHVAYGARPEHYSLAGESLLGAIAAVAGEHWTPVFESAWSAAIDVVVTTMLEGAAEAELAAVA
jgi:hemoglobin-like flavoprotein